jgi:HlyD family secretion protein
MNFLPDEYVRNGIDTYIVKHTTVSQKIYWVTLFVIIGVIISLPFVYVDISVQDSGIIRPIAEKTELRVGVSEFVDSIYVKEGQRISGGDTILTFLRTYPDFKIGYQQKRLEDFTMHLNDLEYLAKGMKPNTFRSLTRKQEYNFYVQQLNEYQTSVAKTKKDLLRNQTLYEKNVIAAEEYENYQYEYNKAVNALALWEINQIKQWQSDWNSYSNSYQEMIASLNQEIKEKDRYTIISTVTGTLDQFNGTYKGSNIQAGSLLAIISPDSTLYAEIYVSPRNIGYIGVGMPVNIQVSSFNYNEWGTISGKVTEISSDFMTDNSGNNAFYKVKCSLDKSYLVRKNGIKGFLKKGMPINSHFILTRRSLFDLLYRKIDDWANPSQYVSE